MCADSHTRTKPLERKSSRTSSKLEPAPTSLSSAIEEVTIVQHKTITEICDSFIERPDKLQDEELEQMIQGYRVAHEKDKKIYLESIYNRIHKKIEIDLKDQDCYFLEETWKKI